MRRRRSRPRTPDRRREDGLGDNGRVEPLAREGRRDGRSGRGPVALDALRRGGERGRQRGPSGKWRAPCDARRHRSRGALMPGIEPSVLVPVVVAAGLYLRGWATLSRRMPARFGPLQAVAFLAGLGIVLFASSALFDISGHRFLWAHMIQHLLLMVVAPPFLWMGAPVAPILLGLPKTVRGAVARGLAWRPLRWLTDMLTHPAVSWIAFVVAFWGWHVPALYDLALEADLWHHVEHVWFLGAALLFWRPVILPWPARSPWPRWAMIPYLVLADLQNSVLAAIFTFSDRVIYPAYATIPRTGEGFALEDQALAGLILWVPGSVLFFVPVLWLVVTTLLPPSRTADRALGAVDQLTREAPARGRAFPRGS